MQFRRPYGAFPRSPICPACMDCTVVVVKIYAQIACRSSLLLQTCAVVVSLLSVGERPPPAMTGFDGGGAAGDLHPALIRTGKRLNGSLNLGPSLTVGLFQLLILLFLQVTSSLLIANCFGSKSIRGCVLSVAVVSAGSRAAGFRFLHSCLDSSKLEIVCARRYAAAISLAA